MLELTLKPYEWLTVYHGGERFHLRLKPGANGLLRQVELDGPRSFEFIRSRAKIKRIPTQEAKPS